MSKQGGDGLGNEGRLREEMREREQVEGDGGEYKLSTGKGGGGRRESV